MDEAARELVEALLLEPHPEGGYYRRVHASAVEVEANGRRRPAMTAIRYLLPAGAHSAWHRVDADEAWHWQHGGVLELLQFDERRAAVSCTRLGPAPSGEAMSCIVPAGRWQAARTVGATVLVACTVAPGFVWDGFELLDPASDLARELRRPDEVGS